jgi:hypothetical protein
MSNQCLQKVSQRCRQGFHIAASKHGTHDAWCMMHDACMMHAHTLHAHPHARTHTQHTDKTHTYTHTHSWDGFSSSASSRLHAYFALRKAHDAVQAEASSLSPSSFALLPLLVCLWVMCVHACARMHASVGRRAYLPTCLLACGRAHTFMHTYRHKYIRTYVRTCIHTCMHTYIHAWMHWYIHTYMHTYMHAYTYTHACMHACIHTYKYIHTHIHTCMHTYIHTYIYTYMQACIKLVSKQDTDIFAMYVAMSCSIVTDRDMYISFFCKFSAFWSRLCMVQYYLKSG